MSETNGKIPFPALTPSQRLYLEINGYVVIENALAPDEVQALLDTTYAIEERYHKTGKLPGPNCHLSGTTVVSGTHKVPTDVAQEDIIKAAMADPRLIHQVEAPAGSTLLFYEALLHSSGIIKSDRDRVLIIGGYTPTMFQTWNGYEPDLDFAGELSEEHRALLTGEIKYGWQRKVRDLGTPAEEV